MQVKDLEESLNLANQTDLQKVPEENRGERMNNDEPYFNSEVRRDIEGDGLDDDSNIPSSLG